MCTLYCNLIRLRDKQRYIALTGSETLPFLMAVSSSNNDSGTRSMTCRRRSFFRWNTSIWPPSTTCARRNHLQCRLRKARLTKAELCHIQDLFAGFFRCKFCVPHHCWNLHWHLISGNISGAFSTNPTAIYSGAVCCLLHLNIYSCLWLLSFSLIRWFLISAAEEPGN